MSQIFNKLLNKIIAFRDARNWKQFHTPKNLAESLIIETSEVLEKFQWLTDEEVKTYIKNNKLEVAEELSDVLIYLIYLSDVVGVDLIESTGNKLKLNEKKYPIEKAKGRHTKYSKL